jgi:pyruvate dehydrogenase (quinone)
MMLATTGEVPCHDSIDFGCPNPEVLADLLNNAGPITLLCGSGCAGAPDQLVALGQKLKSPMVHTLKGKEHVEWDNPYDIGMTGLIGFSSGYYAMNDCDLLLMLPTDFPYRQFYPQGTACIVETGIMPVQLGGRVSLAHGLVSDIAATLDALLIEKQDRRFLDAAVSHDHKTRASLDELAVGRPGTKPLYPQQIAKALSDVAAADAIFTCDVGLPTVWAARYLAMNGKRRLMGSFWHRSMANAMAQGIGAQATFPKRQVVSLCGDGGFTMLMGDFLSLAQLGLPVKVVVFNSGALGFVKLEQKSAGCLHFGTEFKNSDFSAMAEAVGTRGVRLDEAADVEPGIRAALHHNGPVLVDAVVNRHELAIPPEITAELAKGFTLHMVKTIINGRSDEVLDLGRSNLWR